MLSTPVKRVLFPILAAIVAGIIASLFLRHQQPPAPAPTPHREPRLVFKSAYKSIRAIATARDGTLYILEGSGLLYAKSPTGKAKWQFNAGQYSNGLATSPDGTIYVCSPGDVFRALGADGKQKWVQHLFTPDELLLHTGGKSYKKSPSFGDPAVSIDGDVYIVGDERLMAFSPKGKPKFKFDSDNDRASLGEIHVAGSTAYFLDHTALRQDQQQQLRAIDEQGKELWKIPLRFGQKVQVSPDRAQVYLQGNGKLEAYDSHFKKLWEVRTGVAELRQDGQGTLYYFTNDGRIIALTPDGRPLWSVWEHADKLCAEGSGPLYMVEFRKNVVHALDRASGKKLWHTVAPGEGYAFVYDLHASPQGVLYFMTSNYEIYAVDP